MITQKVVENLIKTKLEEKDCFIVDLSINENNNISLELDSIHGFTMQDCVDFSRAIEHNLDRDEEDFELKVSSPGLDKPLRVKKQYSKNLGRTLNVITHDGKIVQGKLEEVDEKKIVLERRVKEKVNGKKKKQLKIVRDTINFNEIKETTVIISFK